MRRRRRRQRVEEMKRRQLEGLLGGLVQFSPAASSARFGLQKKAGDALIQLYTHFISDFEVKINLLKSSHFAVVVSRQYSDKDAGISYLEGVISKLRDTKESRVEEPILYVKMQIASFLLEKGNQKECKKLVDEGKTTLDSMGDVDPSVHSTYYSLCSQYHKVCQDNSEFYKNALLYLAYTTVESLLEPFRQNLAFDLSLAALLGDNIYNIGELLAHPIRDPRGARGGAARWTKTVWQRGGQEDEGIEERVEATTVCNK
ncbi:26S proteasome non-ATPase regulatory subunit 13 homolog B isoform X1 [Triticum aestivum]|uniref:26S proteasome non-ATPase regulatory subunit 13 homolog B isoform X1 n=1 Tax=Triticum aestivum TaxID=4565 RepID=UPI000E7BF4E4|nr:26S proteasome non-ATPase regulatory subunit 13 homolog B-like isoform X1 [Triticum aestivum]XP_044382009.1 26S proteasome non-ATPase regulatory subunit 13 homolog B-like isoform X1 [Triticum aestivum]XP_044382010.1 26S proteasome non-ATPase regulatory subunit 13 homolog B-like isoform X1 [Triticum aestivum]XP_044382011.1 26S proteasome non-ATPase regulatory subunit 13 homolog B-like isoform X1 [Triticum aestivum]XP_044382012.1 26S proteasome non-ATPase regulatory subunit 13 homolog B-like i